MVKEIDLQLVVGYGLIIKQPSNPSWCVMEHRLAKFEQHYQGEQPSANTPVANSDGQINASGVHPVLISTTTYMTEEEKEVKRQKDWDAENLTFSKHETLTSTSSATYIEEYAKNAITKILDKDTQVRLLVFEAYSDYRNEHAGVILFLEAISLHSDGGNNPFSLSLNLDFPVIENKETVDRNLRKVAGALGLEAEGAIGWKLIEALSCFD